MRTGDWVTINELLSIFALTGILVVLRVSISLTGVLLGVRSQDYLVSESYFVRTLHCSPSPGVHKGKGKSTP